jgi:hypothetical protein
MTMIIVGSATFRIQRTGAIGTTGMFFLLLVSRDAARATLKNR